MDKTNSVSSVLDLMNSMYISWTEAPKFKLLSIMWQVPC